MQALLELDCIPSGMELFPAANEDQWTLIKQVIDDCDYYMVIIGGRYGSKGSDGISYTEKEYRYAIEKEKPILAFLHRDPGKISVEKSENLEEDREKLEEFRNFVKNKTVKYWTDSANLGSVVSRSVVQLMKQHPAVSWVRADTLTNEAAAKEILRLRSRIEELESDIQKSTSKPPPGTENLVQGEGELLIEWYVTGLDIMHKSRRMYFRNHFSVNDLFNIISPHLINEATESTMIDKLSTFIGSECSEEILSNDTIMQWRQKSARINDESFQKLKVQLKALGLIQMSTKNRSVKDTKTYWTLTPYGDAVMTRLHAVERDATVRPNNESAEDTASQPDKVA